MSWLAWSLGAVAVWGLGAVASKPSTDRFGPQRMFFWAALAEVVAFAALGLLLPRQPWTWDAAILAVALFAGVTGILGYLFYYEGLLLGTVGVVGTLGAAYPLVTAVLGVLVLGEVLAGLQVVGVALLTLCVVLLAYEHPARRTVPARAVALGISSFLAWGLWGLLAKASVDAIGEGNLFLMYAAADLAVIAAYRAVRPLHPLPKKPARKWSWIALFAVTCGAAGAFAVTIALTMGPASLVTPVSGTYPIIATFGAAALLKEKLRPRVLAALLAFAFGIALVGWA